MSSHNLLLRAAGVVIALAVLLGSPRAIAQTAAPVATHHPVAAVVPTLDSLVATALAANPKIRAAAARVQAARARVGPAGARPDPMLMAGVQNLPVSEPGFSDFMTMKMVGLSQTLPFPGKLGLRERAAKDELRAAEAQLDDAKLTVIRDVRDAYYDIAFADQAMEIVRRNQDVLGHLITVTNAQYTAGTGAQSDVLRARLESARLSEEGNRLAEARRAALARLNVALAWPSSAPLAPVAYPERVLRTAVSDSAGQIHFTSVALGAGAADSPLLPLDSLQALAIRHNPMLRSHEAELRAQAARVELARKASLPDFDVSLQYGQRQGRSDMVSAVVSIPLPIQKGRKQDEEAAAARAELAAREAEHYDAVNAVRASVAQRVSDIERARTQLALSVKAILPQARATLASATAGYQVGRTPFATVMDAQASVFNLETAYYQALTDFAKALADLEQTVGAEVLR
jgi:outer membrane protein, heavy metal efflux system